MRKRLNPEFVLVFLWASIFWTGVLGWQASYAPSEREKNDCYEAAKKAGHKTEECKSLWEKTTSDPIALFTCVLAFSTIGLWVATSFLYIGTKGQLQLAREEFTATHRPKIKIHAVEVTRREVDNQIFIGASVLAFNVGESVAKNVEVRGEIFMGPGFAIDVQRPLVKWFDEVQSGQKLRVEITSDWEASTAAAGKRTGIICYCLGWIAYWDENDQRRETGFCLQPDFSAAHGDRWVSAQKPEYEYEY